MECYKPGTNCAQLEVKERLKPLRPRILIEGPQGSGKTTLSRHLSERFGCKVSRGFPSSKFIKNANSQVEICAKSFELISDAIDSVAVFDRSPISQFVWESRHGTDMDICVMCAQNALRIIGKDGPVIMAFIDCQPELCLSRQDNDTVLAIEGPDVAEEVARYLEFYKRLSSQSFPNIELISLKNENGFSKNEFLEYGESQILSIINKQNVA